MASGRQYMSKKSPDARILHSINFVLQFIDFNARNLSGNKCLVIIYHTQGV